MGKRLISREKVSCKVEKGHLRSSKKAFTLAELMVVCVVIGILFTGVAQKVDNLSDKSKVAGVQADFREFYKATKAVGLEKSLHTLTSAEFEERLNKNLDKELQFTNGFSVGKDPWKTSYRYATKIEGDTFYILFSSNGGSISKEFYLDEAQALGEEEGSDIIYKEEFDAKLKMYMKQEKTQFYSVSDDESEVKAGLEEEVENLIRHAAFSYVNVYNAGGSKPTGVLTAVRNDDTIKIAAGDGISLSVGANKTLTISSTEGAGIRNEMNTILSALEAHKNDGLAHITASEREIWNNASSHAESVHAPSNAERNTIVGISVNGTPLKIDGSRKVNIPVPTKLSELLNDADYTTNANLEQMINNLSNNNNSEFTEINADLSEIWDYLNSFSSVRTLESYTMTGLTTTISHEYLKGCATVQINFAEQYNLVPEYTLDTAAGSLTITCEGTLPANGAIIESIVIYYE